MNRIAFLICLTACVAVVIPAWGADTNVVVSILPQAYFVERIGGERVHVTTLVGSGQSPHTYEPTPRQMADLGRAQLFFRAGLSFEKGFIDTIARTFPHLKIVDTREGVPLRYFGERETAHEPHDGEIHAHEEKASGAPDPHVWLDPGRVKIQAMTIRNALAAAYPADTNAFDANLEAFLADLDEADAAIRVMLAPFRGASLYVFHPSFGYFCDAYGLIQVAVEMEGKEPTPRQLAALIAQARKDGVKIIFSQPQFSKKSASAVAAAIGGVVQPMDPLSRDYLGNLKYMAEAIQDALSRGNRR